MLSTFEMSLDQGKPVLIENMGEGWVDLFGEWTKDLLMEPTNGLEYKVWLANRWGLLGWKALDMDFSCMNAP